MLKELADFSDLRKKQEYNTMNKTATTQFFHSLIRTQTYAYSCNRIFEKLISRKKQIRKVKFGFRLEYESICSINLELNRLENL